MLVCSIVNCGLWGSNCTYLHNIIIFIAIPSCIYIDQYQPLNFVRLTAVNSEQLTFEWNPVSPGCPAISYITATSNCGSCSNGTNMTKSVCSPPQLSAIAMECIFTIQSMACGNVFMDSVFVTLKGINYWYTILSEANKK